MTLGLAGYPSRAGVRLLAAASTAWFAVVGTEHDARAHDTGTEVLLAVLVVDAAAVTYDTFVVASNERPLPGIAAAEAIVALPQVLAYGWLVEQMTRSKESLSPLVAVGAVPSFMMVHGVWGAASRRVDPGALYGASWAVGIDSALTVNAIGAARSPRLMGRSAGTVEMVLTAPQMAVATTEAAVTKDGEDRTGWLLLDGWAGALFVHGAASAVVGDPPREPASSHNGRAPRVPNGPFVDGSLRFAPMPVTGGAGVALRGVLW
jgi:hypothetical protein